MGLVEYDKIYVCKLIANSLGFFFRHYDCFQFGIGHGDNSEVLDTFDRVTGHMLYSSHLEHLSLGIGISARNLSFSINFFNVFAALISWYVAIDPSDLLDCISHRLGKHLLGW